MRVSVIGGGSWGSTLAQVLHDNGHEVLIYDINNAFVEAINERHQHPFFEQIFIPESITATTCLKTALAFSETLVLSVPTKAMRTVLKAINQEANRPHAFINVSKGIEPETLKRVSEIVKEEISSVYYKGYVALTGPSHAEEVILRKLTLLVSASDDQALAKEVQHLFANDQYLRVYTSDDLIGCEVCGAVKNAIAVVSGIATGLGLGENARAALISRGILEIVKISTVLGGKKETAFGLAGIGDLIVTASSEHSRNFQAGKKIGQGEDVESVVSNSKMVVEGIRSIIASKQIAKEYDLELPIIETAYEVLFNKMPVDLAIRQLLGRELKSE